MAVSPDEWLIQAEYDLDSAKAMHETGRYFYAVFMIHLAIEKGLKGLFWKVLKEVPPKTHHLKYLIQKINIEMNPMIKEIVFDLDDLSIPTRYPESLQKILSSFNKEGAEEMINNSTKVIKWINEVFLKY